MNLLKIEVVRLKLEEQSGMRFTKMHGAGNDYIYINCFQEPIPTNLVNTAVAISDRHTGIGGDGMVLICPSKVADAQMRMFNADGSESETVSYTHLTLPTTPYV